MIPLIINVVILAVSLLLIAKIPPIGVEIDSPVKALIGGGIIGLFNGIGGIIPNPITTGIGILSLGLIPLICSTIVFGLSAWLVPGFRLVSGIWSAVMGAISLTIISSILNYVLKILF